MKRVKGQFLTRQSFSKIPVTIDMPNLLDIQLLSYEDFLQQNVEPENRESKGLQAVFETVFPIEDNQANFKIEFLNYFVTKPKYTVEECQDRGMSYSAPLKANLRLSVASEEDKKKIAEVIEQEVFFGNVPTSLDIEA